jgi:hypothetical protein
MDAPATIAEHRAARPHGDKFTKRRHAVLQGHRN